MLCSIFLLMGLSVYISKVFHADFWRRLSVWSFCVLLMHVWFSSTIKNTFAGSVDRGAGLEPELVPGRCPLLLNAENEADCIIVHRMVVYVTVNLTFLFYWSLFVFCVCVDTLCFFVEVLLFFVVILCLFVVSFHLFWDILHLFVFPCSHFSSLYGCVAFLYSHFTSHSMTFCRWNPAGPLTPRGPGPAQYACSVIHPCLEGEKVSYCHFLFPHRAD